MRWFGHVIRIAIVACTSIEALPAQPATHAQYPPPGVLVDVGGYRVHLNCTGAGRPTVVIVGSGYSFDWSLVQSPISTVTRVCTYDPAGSAWSDPGPTSTCDGRILEIHHTLQKGGVAAPVVLVGHSIGAVFARMYAARYPAEVDGMVLSDHAGHYRFAPPPPTPFGTAPVLPSQEQSLEKLPPAAQALHRWAAALPHASSIPFFDRCIAQLDTSKATRRPGVFGNRPLVVIGNASLAASDDYRKVQSELLALSRSATSMTAATYGHDTPLDDPETIVRAIKKVVDDIRKR